MLVLNSPQNPTGGLIPEAGYRGHRGDGAGSRSVVLSDEIYARMYYGEPPLSIASLPGMLEKTIILDGFSKTYAMTGWRIGYGVMPEWLVDAVNKLMVNSNSCTASFTQRAGIAALRGPQDAGGGHGGGISPATRCVLRGLESNSRFPLRDSGRGVLCVRQRERHGTHFERIGRSAVEEAGVACLDGGGVRGLWRGLYPVQLRQLAGEPDGSGGPNWKLDIRSGLISRRLAEGDHGGSPATAFERGVMEREDVGIAGQDGAYSFALDTDAPAMNNPERLQTSTFHFFEPSENHAFHIARGDGMEIENIRDGDDDGFVGIIWKHAGEICGVDARVPETIKPDTQHKAHRAGGNRRI